MTHIEHILLKSEEKAPPRLKARILAHIAETARKAARLRAWVSGTLAGLSALAFGTASLYAAGGASSSGFGTYASLLFTDTGEVAANWKVFFLSLIESAPLFDITLALASVFLFLSFTRVSARNIFIAHRALWI